MKCYNHENVDAVGTCSKCGKAICSMCATSVQGRLRCQECVDSTWLDGSAPEIIGESHTPAHRTAAIPTGTPSRNLFLIGGIGFLLLVVSGILGEVTLYGIAWGLSLPVLAVISLIVTIINILGGLISAVGLYGLYRNYGLGSGVIASLTQIASYILALYAGSLLAEIPMDDLDALMQFFGIIMLIGLVALVNLVFITIVLYQARNYTGMRDLTTAAAIFYLLSFFLNILIPFVPAVAMLLIAYVFFTAETEQPDVWQTKTPDTYW